MKLISFLILIFVVCASLGAQAHASDEQESLNRLGLKPHPTPEGIKSAYRAAVKRFHPDAGTPEASAEKFNSIQEAYDFLRGKITRLPGSSAGTRQGGGFRDFTNPFEDSQPQWKPSGEVPGTDPFVVRFGIQREAEGRLGDKASFTYAMKEKFEAYVKKFESLARSGRGVGAISLYLELDKSLPAAESKIGRDVIFTLIGEHSRRSSREGDAMLKALVNGLGMEQVPDLFSIKRELRLTRSEYGNWPELYPESTRSILSHPGFATLDHETHRRLVLTLMSDNDVKRYPRFYEELAKASSHVRGELEKKRIKRMFARSGAMPDAEFQAQLKVLAENLKNQDSGADGARLKLLEELLGTNRDLSRMGPLVEEAKKIKDFSSFSLMGTINAVMFQGEPRAAATRKEMLRAVLERLARDQPEVAAQERERAGEYLARWGAKGWEEVMAFVDSILNPPPATAEYKIFAQQCSKLYAKTAQLGKGI